MVSGLVGLIVGIVVLGVIPALFKAGFEQAKMDKATVEAAANYRKELARYDNACMHDEIRVLRERVQRNFLIKQRNQLKEKLAASQTLLTKFYEQSGINPKFCNVVAIGYMYEYIDFGIATKLEGVDGLYNLILQKLEWEKLHRSLEEISDKLDEIVDNQRRIYQELVSMNQKCDRIINGLNDVVSQISENTAVLNQIEENTALTNYRLERIEWEESYRNYMMTWEHYMNSN